MVALRILATAAILLALPIIAAGQTTWYVDDDAPNDPGPGDPTVSDPSEDGSPEHPFDAIQEAIDAASDTDTVLVLDGTYAGVGNKNLDFGGRQIVVSSENGPDGCVIDCEDDGRGFYFGSGESVAATVDGLTIQSGYASPGLPGGSSGGAIYCVDASPTIVDCRLIENQGYGAIACDANSDVAIYNCTIEYSSSYGVNVKASSAIATLRGCTLRGNGEDAVACDHGMATITNCLIVGNDATASGGGVSCGSNTTLDITNSTLVGNSASDRGGAVSSAGTTTVTNCLLAGNFTGTEPSDWGGAISSSGTTLTVTNCTIVGNRAYAGGGVYRYSGVVAVANSILWGNVPDQISGSAPVSYSDIEGGWPGTGNIDADPFFVLGLSDTWTLNATYNPTTRTIRFTDANADWPVNALVGRYINPNTSDTRQYLIAVNKATTIQVWADWSTYASGSSTVGSGDVYQIYDYDLLAGSPCIDAANNEAVPADEFDLDDDGDPNEPIPFDLDGNPRFFDDPDTTDTGNGTPPIVDMGADEYQNDCNGNEITDDVDLADCDGSPWCDDCNGNGVLDECDIARYTSKDCDDNGVPDECDIAGCDPNDPTCQDCNGNTIPDGCDIADCDPNDPACQDCNGNAIPDACDIADCDPNDPEWPGCQDVNGDGVPDGCEDCNGNGIPDELDIANCDPNDPACQDCNGNGFPDECDIDPNDPDGNGEVSADCQPNSIPDECDFAACDPNDPACQDCNGNGVPDECDIADCDPNDPACQDCNANGIPDECDIADCDPNDPACQDCNANGIPDECDIAACDPNDPACQDVNFNGVPDGCEDCNGNGVPDDLDIANCDPNDPACQDCNTNGLPDECDIAACDPNAPACQDCNGNGIPDWCDIVNCDPNDPACQDVNFNGVPDGCEDCNGNGVPDDLDIVNCDPNDPACQDCNVNGLPDECDIDPNDPDGNGEVSGDCQPNSIPDECDIADCDPNDPACQDCNGNGVPDSCDIADCDPNDPACQDVNFNGVPDGCEDCNGNGVPDDLDIANCDPNDPACQDCNANGLPDECDIAACDPNDPACQDCNGNGVPDGCDISACDPNDLLCQDCQLDGIPDGCQLTQTDFSGAQAEDDCASAQPVDTGLTYSGTTLGATVDGASACDDIGGFDNIDVWYRYTPAQNGTLTVSTCGSICFASLSIHTGCPGDLDNEIACSAFLCGNGTEVPVDVIAGTEYLIRVFSYAGGFEGDYTLLLTGPAALPISKDCNANGVPDDCDIAACDPNDPACQDCNGNGVPDGCDLAGCDPNDPACQDCNGNGVLDECDIAAGSSQDNNANGIPDDCESCPQPGGSGNYCSVDICPNDGDGVWEYVDDGDCIVNIQDLSQLLGHYGTTAGATREDGDVCPAGGDGAVDIQDLSELLGQYGDDCN